MPRVSVIIPTYNRAHLVGRAIGSVFQQTYQNFEIIVVDDGSTDSTSEVIERLHEPRLRYIRHDTNRGGSAARNTGIEAARGEYIAFLDSDDEWLPRKLEKQVHLLQASEAPVGVVYTGVAFLHEEGHLESTSIPQHRGDILDELCRWNCVGTTSTVLVKHECFLRGHQFDSALASGQDWDMWISLAHDYRFDFIPEVLVRYHEAATGRISTNWQAVLEGKLHIARKYADRFSRKQLAEYRYLLGWALIRWGGGPSHHERLRLGRRLLLEAMVARPFTPRYFIYYCASFNGLYLLLIRARSHFRELLMRLGNVRFRHAPKIGVGPATCTVLGSAEKVDQPQQRRPALEDRSKAANLSEMP